MKQRKSFVTGRKHLLHFRTLVNTNDYENSTNVSYIKNNNIELQNEASNTSLSSLDVGSYVIKIGSSEYNQKFSLGGVYTVLAIAKDTSNFVSCFVLAGRFE